jgi:hypothetical protein
MFICLAREGVDIGLLPLIFREERWPVGHCWLLTVVVLWRRGGAPCGGWPQRL